MPPAPKFTREEIAEAAFDIVKEEGLDALTARRLGERLGSSARPIFTVFDSMMEVKMAARALALKEYYEYIKGYEDYVPAFKQIGVMTVSYGVHRPELFKLLFMQERDTADGRVNLVEDLGEVAELSIKVIMRDYSLSKEDTIFLFEQVWIYALGITSLYVMGACNFDEKELSERLSFGFGATMLLIQSGKHRELYGAPAKSADKKFYGVSVGDHPFHMDEK